MADYNLTFKIARGERSSNPIVEEQQRNKEERQRYSYLPSHPVRSHET